MNRKIAHIALLVKDYDPAIKFYKEKLDFTILEDTRLTEEKRWVIMAPPGSTACAILLAKAANETQAAYIGNQTGGRVFLFLHTDDFWRDFNSLKERKVHFIREPKEEPYGWVAVFEDLYGNLWDLVQAVKATL